VTVNERARVPSVPSVPSLFARALAIETGRLDALRIRAWRALGGALMAGGSLTWLLLGAVQGVVALVIGVVVVAWFSLVGWQRARGERSVWAAAGSVVVEQSVFSAFFIGAVLFDDPLVALRAWGPVLTFVGSLVLGILRLSPRYCVMTGAIGSIMYFTSAVVVALPRLPLNEIDQAEQDVAGQIVRACLLLAGSMVTAIVAGGLRNALGGVARTIREQDLFGKYRLEHELAAGGFGAVWRATYCPEGGFVRPAAVKLIHPHLAAQDALVSSFRAEAELGARLVHPNIVQVLDFGRVDNRYFLAMELVDGMTLRELMRRASDAGRAIPPAVVATVTRSILRGLAFAHEEARDPAGLLLRVVHRDLSPSNVLVSTTGAVKITDFGIARALRNAEAAHTENIAGHFAHMAPEQVEAAPIDARADLFCAGIIAWEMLCGRSLFQRDNDAATLNAVLRAEIAPPSSVNGELAPWDAFVARALARHVTQRFARAAEMIGALDALADHMRLERNDDVVAAFAASLPVSERAAGVPATATVNEQTATGFLR
jgi:eukaryotic-like serine/threonine-protein kinase